METRIGIYSEVETRQQPAAYGLKRYAPFQVCLDPRVEHAAQHRHQPLAAGAVIGSSRRFFRDGRGAQSIMNLAITGKWSDVPEKTPRWSALTDPATRSACSSGETRM